MAISTDAPPPRRKRAGGEIVAWAEFRYQIRRWIHLSEEHAAAAGLPPQHYQMLLAIKGYPDGTPRIADLAERMQLRHHSTVGLLDRMEASGLIERRPLHEGRAVAIVLTPDGEQVFHEVYGGLRAQRHAAAYDLIDTLSSLLENAPAARRRTAGSRSARPSAAARPKSRTSSRPTAR